jgi:hypothetical protein
VRDKIVDLRHRFQRSSAPRPVNPHPQSAGIEAVGYELAAIHEGVPITLLVSALNRQGLTVSNVRGRGLVIHRIGQHPERAAHPSPLGAS